MMYAQQTEAITRMRGMLEDEATQKKAQMMKEMHCTMRFGTYLWENGVYYLYHGKQI